jgi:PucR C-terminal helix-turn-helix domain/GGDEF-like domain
MRLQARRPEIEAAALSRIYNVSDPGEVADPEYVEGLRMAVTAALDYGFASLSEGERSSPQIPIVLRAQARLAARNGISLDTVLRRYFAGYAVLSDFVVEEAEQGDLTVRSELKALLHIQSTLLDRVVAAISDEYSRESCERLDSTEERRTELVKRLLAGERLDTTELAYDLDAHHVAMVAGGPGAEEVIKRLTKGLDHRLLVIRREEVSWAWVGTRRGFDPAWLENLTSEGLPADVFVAFGEPGEALRGWSMSHRQAMAALPVARRQGGQPVRYSAVALLTSMLQNDLLTNSLRELYMAPLEIERDGGAALRETLRAYFAAGRNVSCAAAALGVSRRTVANRLHVVESRLGHPLEPSMMPALEAALQLHELKAVAADRGAGGGR